MQKDTAFSLTYILNKKKANIQLFSENFVKRNKKFCIFFVDGKKNNLTQYFNAGKIKHELRAILYMSKDITDISEMFYGCESLKMIEILNFNLNVTKMNSIFYNCKSLSDLNNLSAICTRDLTDMSYIFYNCTSLKYLPDISKWNTSKVINMEYMFFNCISLKSLPEISKWDISKVTDLKYMFYNCSSLETLPDISKWKTSNVIYMTGMFQGCKSLYYLPNITYWNTKKVIDMSYMFYNCNSLKNISDMLSWKEFYIKNHGKLKFDPDYWFAKKLDTQNIIRNDELKYFPQLEIKFNKFQNINDNIILNLKKELEILLSVKNFSIIEINKGSLIIKLTLQYLTLRELNNNKNISLFTISEDFDDNIKIEMEKVYEKVKNHQFNSLGNEPSCPDYIFSSQLQISKNTKNIEKDIEKMCKKNIQKDMLEISIDKFVDFHILTEYFNILAKYADAQENNQKRLIDDLEKFNILINEQMEKSLRKCYFEYKITKIFLINKDIEEYAKNKSNCPNCKTKILFHGTQEKNIVNILPNDFYDSSHHTFGKGVYFTDNIEYAWYYGGIDNRVNLNNYSIPKVNQSFSFVLSEVYYNKNLFEKIYLDNVNEQTKNDEIIKNGIRFYKVDYTSTILSREDLENYNGFIGTEYLISDHSQFLPLFGVIMERIEFLVIWRDNNLDKENPNQYIDKVFNEMKIFHEKIQNLLSNVLNCKIYYSKSTEDALNILEKKKYNKVIIVTNGSNEAKEFILSSRRIIGSNSIAAVSAYDAEKHIQWVKDMRNVLLLNGIDFHRKFFESVIKCDRNGLTLLRKEIIDFYKKDIPNFNFMDFNEELFSFRKYIENGSFENINNYNNDNFCCHLI